MHVLLNIRNFTSIVIIIKLIIISIIIVIIISTFVKIFLFTVTHKWRLHFEFSTVRKGYELGSESPVLEGVVYQAPAVVPVETMIWDLPIKVYATNPLYVSSVSLLKMDTSCIL